MISIPSSHLITLPEFTLIGIHGHASSGKDSIASYIQTQIGDSYIHAFAQFLKDACVEAFGLDSSDFNDSKKKEQVHEYWGVSPRKMAQFFGTELFREQIPRLLPGVSNDFWIRRLVGHINGDLDTPEGWGAYDSGDTLIIPDVRFQNETDFILGNGGYLIHVVRENADGKVGLENHASEWDLNLDQYNSENYWRIFNNGTLEELYNEVDQFLDYYKLAVKSLNI